MTRPRTGSTRLRTCWDGCCRYRWTAAYLVTMSTLTFLAVLLHWRV